MRRYLHSKIRLTLVFSTGLFKKKEKCTPETSPVNFCGIFTGEVSVFGKDQGDPALQVMAMIEEVLNPLDSSEWHPELTKLAPVEEHFKIIDTVSGKSKGGIKIENLAWAGLALVILMVCMCMWWFQIRHMKQGDTMFASSSSSSTTGSKRSLRTWNRFFRRHQRRTEYNPEANSIKPSYEPEAEAYGGGGGLGGEKTRFLNQDDFDDEFE